MWCFFFFKQKTAYEMRISDWSSDVCSSDLLRAHADDVDTIIAVAVDRDGGVLQLTTAVVEQEADVIHRDPGQAELLGGLLAAENAGVRVVEVAVIDAGGALACAPAALVARVLALGLVTGAYLVAAGFSGTRSDARRVGNRWV